jgi:hypothetical protein
MAVGDQREFSSRSHRAGSRRSLYLRVEELERRDLFSAGLGGIFAAPEGHGVTNPFPVGYDPAQIRHAYGFDQVSFGSVSGDGAGQTIAIVDAYNDPNILKDLDVFDKTFSLNNSSSLYQQYGAARSFLTKATPQGNPRTNSGWAGEISLDVEWAHAIAPGAKILLVEAVNSSLGALLGAVAYANSQPGVVAVSMSWGGAEFSAETLYDSYFTTAGITYVAAAGDSPGAIWPSASPNVLSVGGTSLTGLNAAGDYASATETGWNSSGGGASSVESLPSYQTGVTGTSTRATPDVAFDADPNTGVAIYDSVPYFGQSGWFQAGGTSLGAPAWAALVAIADQGRGAAGSLSAGQTLSALYTHSGDFHDITSGTSGSNSAGPGYDQVTGLGAPKANLLVQDLVNVGKTAAATSAKPATSTGTTSGGTATPKMIPGSSDGSSTSTSGTSTASQVSALNFFLFLNATQPIGNSLSNSGNTVLSNVPPPAPTPFVPIPPSTTFFTGGSSSVFNSAGDYARGGLGPVLPDPRGLQQTDTGSDRPDSGMKREKAPGDSSPAPSDMQKDKGPATPDNKNEDAAPAGDFWDGDWAIGDGALQANEELIGEAMPEAAALVPGLVAFLGGSWAARLIDPNKNKKRSQLIQD